MSIENLTVLEKCCIEHLQKNDTKFTYLFRDVEFAVEIKPLWSFLLKYAQIRNRTDEIQAVLSNLDRISEEDIKDSMLRVVPTMSDLISNSHPRFVIHYEDKIFLFIAESEHFTANKEHAVTSELYSKIPSGMLVTKEFLKQSYNELLKNPDLVQEKSDAATEIEEYTKQYLNILESNYEKMFYRIHFQPNKKFGPYEEDFPLLYIGFSDMSIREVNIRHKIGEDYDDTNDPIVASYGSLKDLLMDGWKLD